MCQRSVLLEDIQVSCDVGVRQCEPRQGTELTELLGQGTVEIMAKEVDVCDVASVPGQKKWMARGDASPQKDVCG